MLQRTEAPDSRSQVAMANAIAAQRQNRDRLRQQELAKFGELERLSTSAYPELRLLLEAVPAEHLPAAAHAPADEGPGLDAGAGNPMSPTSPMAGPSFAIDLSRLGYRRAQPLNARRNVYAATNAAGDSCVVKTVDLDTSLRGKRIQRIRAAAEFLRGCGDAPPGPRAALGR